MPKQLNPQQYCCENTIINDVRSSLVSVPACYRKLTVCMANRATNNCINNGQQSNRNSFINAINIYYENNIRCPWTLSTNLHFCVCSLMEVNEPTVLSDCESSEVLVIVSLTISVFRDVTMCCCMGSSQHFKGIWCLSLQYRMIGPSGPLTPESLSQIPLTSRLISLPFPQNNLSCLNKRCSHTLPSTNEN